MDAKKWFFINSGGTAYPYLTTIEARWTSLGYTHPTAAVKTSLNTLLSDFTGYGVLTGFDALWVPMLNDSALVSTTGAINLVSPSNYQMTFPVAPTYTASGFIGNGSSQYALTNFNPSTNGVQYTRDSATRGLFKYAAGTAGGLDGHVASFNNTLVNGSSTAHRVNSNAYLSGAVSFIGTGYRAISRTTSNDNSTYVDTTRADRTSASAALVNENFTVLRGGGSSFSDAGIALYFIGRAFTETEHNNIRTAFLAHKSRLGL